MRLCEIIENNLGGNPVLDFLQDVEYSTQTRPKYHVQAFKKTLPDGKYKLFYKILDSNHRPINQHEFSQRNQAQTYLNRFFPIAEGHGRYWCSTDRRWKTRKGPKQTRS